MGGICTGRNDRTVAHWPLFSAFLIASVALAIAPDPAAFYIVARSFSRGRGPGLASVAGIAVGSLGNAPAAVATLTNWGRKAAKNTNASSLAKRSA
ncbi:MAG: hypothetical protein KGJ55_01280 [Gammaproteobacteria bacterium]|nr:hypothetical protein [Gammaproteobacteria bacterium]